MFIENEITGNFTFLRLVLAIVIGIAPIVVTIAIKLMLYRRRLAEDKSLDDQERERKHVPTIIPDLDSESWRRDPDYFPHGFAQSQRLTKQAQPRARSHRQVHANSKGSLRSGSVPPSPCTSLAVASCAKIARARSSRLRSPIISRASLLSNPSRFFGCLTAEQISRNGELRATFRRPKP